MRIGELAQSAGVTRDAIRFYERLGLITPERGSEGQHGYRRYDQAAVRRLGLIKQAQTLGFSLGEIRELLDAWADHTFKPAQKRAVIAQKIAVIQHKITEMQALAAELQLVHDGIRDNCQ